MDWKNTEGIPNKYIRFQMEGQIGNKVLNTQEQLVEVKHTDKTGSVPKNTMLVLMLGNGVKRLCSCAGRAK
jgi:hypothetical protein